MEPVAAVILCIGLIFFPFLLYYCRNCLTSNFDFWKKRNVKGPRPLPVFGNFKDAILGNTNFAFVIRKICREYKSEPLIGVFAGIFDKNSPMLIVRDPRFIKEILKKDSEIFPTAAAMIEHRLDEQQKVAGFPTLSGRKSPRPTGNVLSILFDWSKRRNYYSIIIKYAHNFEKFLETLETKSEPIECCAVVAAYTICPLIECAFQLHWEKCDLGGSEGISMVTFFRSLVKRMNGEWFPKVFGFLGPLECDRYMKFTLDRMADTLKTRKADNMRENDFIDLLLDVRDQAKRLFDLESDDALATSQALAYFLAGFESSSTIMTNALYELALNPHIQDSLRDEIRKEVKVSGELKKFNIKQMEYLSQVVSETVRKYPPDMLLQRKSAGQYTFPGTEVTIPKNTRIIIPVFSIHHDPDIYPISDVFDPERFRAKIEETTHPKSFLFLSDGIFHNLGLQFADYLTKIGIAILINKFKIELYDHTCIPYCIHPRSLIPAHIEEIRLKITKA